MSARLLAGCSSLLLAAHAVAAAAEAESVQGILDLQPASDTTTVTIGTPEAPGTATLINLGPRVNTWYILILEWQGNGSARYFHLENPAPVRQIVVLDGATRRGLVVRTDLDGFPCELWPTRAAAPLEEATRSGAAYAPLCDGRLYLRNQSTGYRTTRELVTDFLRDRVHLESSTARPVPGASADPASGPLPAMMDDAESGLRPLPGGLGIALELPAPEKLAFGPWYPATAVPAVHVSVMQPGLVAASRLAGHRDRVRPLDATEAKALVYLVAFDLAELRLGYELGTDHPRLGWSERALPEVRDSRLVGPDGIDSAAPLVRTGLVNPEQVSRTVATFTGGFKRSHGAFRHGELARTQQGSHYGWVQHGVVFSTLQPGLATLIVHNGGGIGMRTWEPGDDRLLADIRHARQNGVPVIEPDAASGEPVPGALVGNWGAGNWSGSAEGEQRTVRGGICLQESEAGQYLVYGYFSSATPSAMARVFQAYRCRYAMLLDMNALEHTYLALYHVEDSEIRVQHLVKGMEAVDRTVRGRSVPRFIGYPDSRDFFYVLRRRENEP